MHVFIPNICDTAYIKDMNDEEFMALCDYLDEARKASPDGVVVLRWTKRTSPARKPSLLILTKYWVTPSGVRKLRIQCHKIYQNGRFGWREILEERHQGRIVR